MTPKDVKWLCEATAFDEKLDDLFCALKEQGNEYKIVKYQPFESGEYNCFTDDSCVMFYGSLNLMRQLQRKKIWLPGGYCDFNNFKCSSYYTYLGEHLLNDKYAMMPLSEVIRNKDFVYSTFGIDNAIFVRPDSGGKEFAGKIVYKENISLEELGYGFYHENPNLLVVVSFPKNISSEWRFVIANHEVVTCSQYKNLWEGKLEVAIEEGCPQDALEYAETIAKNEWQPDPIYTMDVCRSNDELKLIEINSFSCSGLYACDKKKIVKAASEIALKEWEDYQKYEIEW